MSAYDSLATNYDMGRIGYANELYQTIVDYGLGRTAKILDVACGTGIASRPFVENDYDVTGVDQSDAMLEIARSNLPQATWVQGSAEALPFDDATFDAALSAQAFHQFDRVSALREMLRVLRPGGIVAIWWKQLMADDPYAELRASVAREIGAEPVPEGLTGGFKEFYGAALRDHTLRIIPWRAAIGLEQILAYERSRKSLRDALGSKTALYFQTLEARLRDRHAGDNPLIPLGYMHYLYLGKK